MFSNTSGGDNTTTGCLSMNKNITGSANCAYGSNALKNNMAGSYNTCIGFSSGFTGNGSGNVFLGNMAGYFESGSDKLYIDNSDVSTPLIYGDFAENKLTINDVLRIAPRDAAPGNPAEGELYVNSVSHHIYCYLNGSWHQLD